MSTWLQDMTQELGWDMSALVGTPSEIPQTMQEYWSSADNAMNAAKQEIAWDVAALGMLPEEMGKSAAQIVTPAAQALTPVLTNTKWILIAALGIYALVLFTPELKTATAGYRRKRR